MFVVNIGKPLTGHFAVARLAPCTRDPGPPTETLGGAFQDFASTWIVHPLQAPGEWIGADCGDNFVDEGLDGEGIGDFARRPDV